MANPLKQPTVSLSSTVATIKSAAGGKPFYILFDEDSKLNVEDAADHITDALALEGVDSERLVLAGETEERDIIAALERAPRVLLIEMDANTRPSLLSQALRITLDGRRVSPTETRHYPETTVVYVQKYRDGPTLPAPILKIMINVSLTL